MFECVGRDRGEKESLADSPWNMEPDTGLNLMILRSRLEQKSRRAEINSQMLNQLCHSSAP